MMMFLMHVKKQTSKENFMHLLSKVYESVDFFINADDEVKNDIAFVKEVVQYSGLMLEHVSKKFQDNKLIVKIASSENPNSLQFASARLRNNKDVVMSSVKIWGSSLQYASKKLKNDIEIVLAACRARPSSIQYASDEIKNNKSFIVMLEKINPEISSWINFN